ncbi:hypothetical protein J4E80_002337 [Alternaria sp. BMP 0032]|nr:hypothetical protein J4E80_002337 [Alternaria sp. BMP 0032]
MGDGNQQPPSVDWASADITSNPAMQYSLVLSLAEKPVATVQVLLPITDPGRGIVYTVTSGFPPGAPQTLTLVGAAATTATFDGHVLSVDLKPSPPHLLFQTAPASSSILPSTSLPATSAAALPTTAATPASTSSQATKTGPSETLSPGTSVPILPQSEGSDLSTGAIAGIAIGCFAAGALLAGAILWFCRRRRRQPKNQYPQPDTYALASQEKGFSASAIPLAGKRSSVAALGGGLPQPLEDKAISGDVSKISNAIKNHVQSYYHTSRVNPGLIDYEDLHALGPGLPVSVGTLTTLIGNAATREIALRFIIAWVIVSKLRPSKDPSKSLLPSEVAQCYQAVATGDRGYQGMRHEFLRLQYRSTDFRAAQTSLMARWRVMTAELMQASYIRNPFGPSDSRHPSIQATLATLDNVLQPYADSRMNNGERKRNLEEVLKRAALFAFTLFSQPSAWEFEWQEEQGVTSGDLCIFPALVQVADEAGNPVSPPRPFSEAVVRRLDA